MPTDIMGFQCSTPNVGVSKIHLFSYKLRDTKQEINSLQHSRTQWVKPYSRHWCFWLVNVQVEFLRENVETLNSIH